ncbi:arylsulfatase [Maribellus maritimus]|uniref:arylsulfatase n=1 Tax=Maribellus maritimus TaxID=2870838 RepID=UPI001EEAB5C9|nr:arylsulfatase [Maribellus maritimus]MCG6188613.1 arylsulfatase [Maribellus maritimus]
MKNKLILLIFFIAFCASVGKTAPNKKGTKPNIIYILADDLGYGDLGTYGQKVIKTPNIDNLAKEGMQFTQHYAGSTVCAPSRSTLLTGQHTGHTYVRFNGDYQMRPDPEDITVARYLKEAGYATAMIGKSSTGCLTTPGQPNEKGFDLFYGYLGHGQAHAYFPKYLHRNREQINFPGNGGSETWRGKIYSPDLMLEEALKFIKEEKDKPFFLFYASTLPHAQMWAPEEFEKPYKGKFEETPFMGRKPGRNPHYGVTLTPNATTAAMISRLDWEVGKILKQLKEMGIDDNTVIMFSSDNGPHQEGGRSPEFFNSSGPFRGIKRDLYEGGIRMPFIVKWPGIVEPGVKSEHISAFWDILPTLTDIAGAKTPKDIDGISFLPTLKGKPKKQKEHEYLYWEFYERGGKQAVRKGNWKAIKQNVSKNPGTAIELYDLNKDPKELNNLADAYPEIVKEMAEIIKTARVESSLKPLFKY